MPHSIQQLREDRNKLAVNLRAFVDGFDDDYVWTDENNQSYDEQIVTIENLDKKIEREEKLIKIAGEKIAKNKHKAERNGVSEDEQNDRDEKKNKAFNVWARNGFSGLSEEDREALMDRQRNPKNALGTAVGAEGGFIVSEEYASNTANALKEYGGIRSRATTIQTASGQTLNYPATDFTTEEGEIIGENDPASDEDTGFQNIPIDTYKYSSKVIVVPFELLDDSFVDLESHLGDVITSRLGRITERMYTTGTGVNQPFGIMTSAAVGRVSASNVTPSYDDILALEHSVDPAYRKMGATWQFNDQTLLAIKSLRDTQQRPLWLPDVAGVAPATFDGYGYDVNQSIDVPGANAEPIAFGDFSKYIIRQVMQMAIFRFTDSAYVKNGQIAFLAWMREGGRFTDIGGAVKKLQMAP